MSSCALCGREVDVGRQMSRKETCPSCKGDLHICLNCRFYSEAAHNKCIETRADHQREREKTNFCDYFQYKEGGGGSSGDDSPSAKKAFDNLFK